MTAPQQHAAPGIFSSLWDYRWLSLAIVVLVTGLSGVAGLVARPPASASASVALKTPTENNVLAPGVVGDASLTRYVQQRAKFATNDSVLSEVGRQNGGATITDLRERITVTPITGSNVFTVTAKAPTAEAAVALANATVAAYRSQTAATAAQLTKQAADELAASQDALRSAATGNRADALSQAAGDTMSDLQKQSARLRVDSLLYGDGVDFVNAARVDGAFVAGAPIRELAVGGILGVALAAMVSWLRSDRKRRMRDASSPALVLDAPLLGVVPRLEHGSWFLSRPTATSANRAAAMTRSPLPQYQLVGAALLRRTAPGVVSVVGPSGRSSDRTEAALSIAAAVANDGGRVLLVDADPTGALTAQLRTLLSPVPGTENPMQHLPTVQNLRPVTVGEGDGDGSGTVVQTETASSTRIAVVAVRIREDIEISMLSPGTDPDMTTAASAREFAQALWDDHERYDMIVIDTPSIDATPLVPALIRVSTGILAVVPRGTGEDAVAQIRQTAEISSTPLLGFVYTGARGVG